MVSKRGPENQRDWWDWSGDAIALISTILFVGMCFLHPKLSELLGKYSNWFTRVLASSFLMFLALSLILRLRGAQRRRLQAARDSEADLILARVYEGEPCIFGLYLRSFEITNALPLPPVSRPPGMGIGELFVRDLEELVAQAVQPVPLVALGRPGEAVGAARVATCEADWREIAAILIKKAAVIIIVPSLSEGVTWELEQVKSLGQPSKTIFLMPPCTDNQASMAEAAWDALRHAARDSDVVFPAYDACGKVFSLDKNGHVGREISISSGDPPRITAERLTLSFQSILPWLATADSVLLKSVDSRHSR